MKCLGATEPDQASKLSFQFVSLLEKTLHPEQTTPAWCDGCQKYSTTNQTRVPKNFPNILSVNTCLDGPAKDFEGWTTYMESLLAERNIRRGSGSGDANGAPNSPPGMVLCGGVKACRYGGNCTRPDCKFRHEGRPLLPGLSLLLFSYLQKVLLTSLLLF